MGTKQSTPAPVIIQKPVEVDNSSGFHILEIHAPSVGMSFMVIILLLILGTAFYFCLRRYRHRLRRHRQRHLHLQQQLGEYQMTPVHHQLPTITSTRPLQLPAPPSTRVITLHGPQIYGSRPRLPEDSGRITETAESGSQTPQTDFEY